MISHISKKTKSFFWISNTLVWAVYAVIFHFFFYWRPVQHFEGAFEIVLTFICGFCVSLLLRFFYKRIQHISISILWLASIVFLSSIIAAVIWFYLDALLSIPIYGQDRIIRYLNALPSFYFLKSLSYFSIALISWSGIYFLVKFWVEYEKQAGQTEQAHITTHNSQIELIRYQLNPNFLFNSLNSIRALVYEDKKKAKNMITELSELLRYSLVTKRSRQVPLKEELAAIRLYFSIQKKRYKDKLIYEFKTDRAALDYLVPSFFLHPLAENAVKHGMKSSPLPLKIRVMAKVEGGKLCIDLCNSGKWFEPALTGPVSSSDIPTGLEYVRERLKSTYQNEYSVEIKENGGCVHVCLEISRRGEMNEADAV